MVELKYFDIPKYPEAFLKTKLGKKCLFYSVLPYLCECGSSRKKGKNSKFNKCKALCSQIKIDMLINRIYKNKHKKDSESNQCNNLEEELMISCLKQTIPYGVLTKKEKLTKYEMALKEELIFFKDYSKYKDKYSRRDIIISLTERMPSFLKLYSIAAECKRVIEKEKNYSLQLVAEKQFPKITKAENSTHPRYDFLEDEKFMPLMPLIYGLFHCFKDEKSIPFYVLDKTAKGKTKRFVQFDGIKSSSVDGLLEYIDDRSRKKYIYKEEDGTKDNKDFLFKNKAFLCDNFSSVITDTNNLSCDLLNCCNKVSKQYYFSFKQ